MRKKILTVCLLLVLAGCGQQQISKNKKINSSKITKINQQESNIGTIESPEKVLEKYNASTSGQEAVQYLSGLVEQQFISLMKKDPKLTEQILNHNKMKTYQTKTVPINEDLQFVFVSDIKFFDEKENSIKHDEPSLYEFEKLEDQWKIKMISSGHVIIDLFKQKYSPELFYTKNSFQFEEKEVGMESAFAYYTKEKDNKTNIFIKFYPFQFQEGDVDYLKRSSWIDTLNDKSSMIASTTKYPQSEFNIYLDENDKIISFCLGRTNFKSEQKNDYLCIQSDSLIEKFDFTKNNLTLITKGKEELSGDKKAIWNININLPIFKQE